jgi:hypothetical protein
MAFCATLMLATQLLGLHFHRHTVASDVAVTRSSSSTHLRDAGLHVQEIGPHAEHHAFSDRASHPGEDVEIDPLVAGFAKFFKVCVGAGVLLLALLWLVHAARPTVPALSRSGPSLHPALFVLRPPSHAPPPPILLWR